MPEIGYLKDLVIVLASAAVVVAILRRVGVPFIAGFILAGTLVGPMGLRLVDDTRQVEVLSEIGVVLLLFGIGLEISLERFRRLWKAVLLGGGIQVGVTIVCTVLLASGFGLTPRDAVFLGCVIAVSSTAIVLRGLSARGELEAPHGRLAVGILVFQDLCVVPMILAVPFLAGRGGSTQEIVITIVTAAAILTGVLVGARHLVPRLLAFVAQTRERELFILTVFLVCFGTAWILSLAGIPLALGAFLAGMVVAGSEFRHQAMSDLIPAREVLSSFFFVSVGMLLDVSDVFENLIPTVGLLGAILMGKFTIILGTALLLRLPLRVGILSAATAMPSGRVLVCAFKRCIRDRASGGLALPQPPGGDHPVHVVHPHGYRVWTPSGQQRSARSVVEPASGRGACWHRRSRTAQRPRDRRRIWLDRPGGLPRG